MEKKFEFVDFSLENGIANIFLNRPRALNALDDKIISDLKDAFELCEDEKVKVIVLSGRGKGFSSGGDIKLMTQIESTPHILNNLLENLHKVVVQMRNLDKPIIAAINGFAYGAGFSLALACDFRVASQNAEYSCSFINIGLVPDSGASFFLTKLLGYAKATELMLLGDSINSEEAFRLGLLTKIVSDEEVLSTAQELAKRLLHKPSTSISRIKKLANKAIISDLSDQLALEAMYQSEAAKTDNFKEGIRAFVEKRYPKFN